MSWVAAAVVGGNIVSGMMQSGAAEHAADLQAGAARDATALQKAMFDTQNAQQAPYRSSGYGALNKINSMMGGPYVKYDYQGNPVGTTTPNAKVTPSNSGSMIGDLASSVASQVINGQPDTITPTQQTADSDYLTHQFNAQDFQNGIDPGYAWRLKMGQDQAMRQANLGGGAIGGNALAGLQDYTQGSASQEYGNAFNRYQTQRGNIYNTLASIAGLGQTSLGQTGTAATAAGANIGNSIMNAGSAAAGGVVGSANALAGGIQNAGNAYMLNSLLKPQAAPTATPQGYGTPVQQPFDVNVA
jgi:hypothetical protein